jgi:DNA-binding Lrp family transcriptional regulator
MNRESLKSSWPDPRDAALLAVLQEGLPLESRPYAVMGARVGYTEEEVIERLARWQALGVIKRLGVIVRHRRLGYDSNAMVVWDIPDDEVREVARRLCELPFVTLCYRRPRQLPDWPYNLFCMIHGQDRSRVEAQIRELIDTCGIADRPTATLFSTRCFKQRGARYGAGRPEPAVPA